MASDKNVSKLLLETDDTILLIPKKKSGKGGRIGLVSQTYRGQQETDSESESDQDDSETASSRERRKLKPGFARVEWFPSGREDNINEDRVVLLDRSLLLGETVCRRSNPNFVGYVRDVRMCVDAVLLPKKDWVIRNIRGPELTFLCTYDDSASVCNLLYNNWLGILYKVSERILIRSTKEGWICWIMSKDTTDAVDMTWKREQYCSYDNSQWYPSQVLKLPMHTLSNAQWLGRSPPERFLKRVDSGCEQLMRFTVEKVELESIEVRWVGPLPSDSTAPSGALVPPPPVIEREELKNVQKLDPYEFQLAEIGDRLWYTPTKADVGSGRLERFSRWQRLLEKRYTDCDPSELCRAATSVDTPSSVTEHSFMDASEAPESVGDAGQNHHMEGLNMDEERPSSDVAELESNIGAQNNSNIPVVIDCETAPGNESKPLQPMGNRSPAEASSHSSASFRSDSSMLTEESFHCEEDEEDEDYDDDADGDVTTCGEAQADEGARASVVDDAVARAKRRLGYLARRLNRPSAGYTSRRSFPSFRHRVAAAAAASGTLTGGVTNTSASTGLTAAAEAVWTTAGSQVPANRHLSKRQLRHHQRQLRAQQAQARSSGDGDHSDRRQQRQRKLLDALVGRRFPTEIVCSRAVLDIVWSDGRLERGIPSRELAYAHLDLDDHGFLPGNFVSWSEAAAAEANAEASALSDKPITEPKQAITTSGPTTRAQPTSPANADGCSFLANFYDEVQKDNIDPRPTDRPAPSNLDSTLPLPPWSNSKDPLQLGEPQIPDHPDSPGPQFSPGPESPDANDARPGFYEHAAPPANHPRYPNPNSPRWNSSVLGESPMAIPDHPVSPDPEAYQPPPPDHDYTQHCSPLSPRRESLPQDFPQSPPSQQRGVPPSTTAVPPLAPIPVNSNCASCATHSYGIVACVDHAERIATVNWYELVAEDVTIGELSRQRLGTRDVDAITDAAIQAGEKATGDRMPVSRETVRALIANVEALEAMKEGNEVGAKPATEKPAEGEVVYGGNPGGVKLIKLSVAKEALKNMVSHLSFNSVGTGQTAGAPQVNGSGSENQTDKDAVTVGETTEAHALLKSIVSKEILGTMVSDMGLSTSTSGAAKLTDVFKECMEEDKVKESAADGESAGRKEEILAGMYFQFPKQADARCHDRHCLTISRDAHNDICVSVASTRRVLRPRLIKYHDTVSVYDLEMHQSMTFYPNLLVMRIETIPCETDPVDGACSGVKSVGKVGIVLQTLPDEGKILVRWILEKAAGTDVSSSDASQITETAGCSTSDEKVYPHELIAITDDDGQYGGFDGADEEESTVDTNTAEDGSEDGSWETWSEDEVVEDELDEIMEVDEETTTDETKEDKKHDEDDSGANPVESDTFFTPSSSPSAKHMLREMSAEPDPTKDVLPTVHTNPPEPSVSTENVDVPQQQESSTQNLGGSFDMIDAAYSGHHFISGTLGGEMPSKIFMKALRTELQLMQTALPPGLHVKSFEDRIDLMSAMILGPQKTPFADGLFLFDIQLPRGYPNTPPLVHYRSFTTEQLNPNLYPDGKVCVSLLGTWTGKDSSEIWNPGSNLLQVLVSIQGLILNSEPYFNEAGYENRRPLPESVEKARIYNEVAVLQNIDGLTKIARSLPEPFRQECFNHLKQNGTTIISRVQDWISNSDACGFPLQPVSKGFTLCAKRYLAKLETALTSLSSHLTTESS